MPFESIEGILVIKYIEEFIYCFIGMYAFKTKIYFCIFT